MIMRTRYGTADVPKIEASSGRQKCPFCENKHKKGTPIVYLPINNGPTGTVHYCLEHAKQLAAEMLEIASSCPAEICGKGFLIAREGFGHGGYERITCTQPKGAEHDHE